MSDTRSQPEPLGGGGFEAQLLDKWREEGSVGNSLDNHKGSLPKPWGTPFGCRKPRQVDEGSGIGNGKFGPSDFTQPEPWMGVGWEGEKGPLAVGPRNHEAALEFVPADLVVGSQQTHDSCRSIIEGEDASL